MFAELSTNSATILALPSSTSSMVDFPTNDAATGNPSSPVHVMDFTSSDTSKPKTAMVVIPKHFLPDLTADSVASALAARAGMKDTSTSCTTFSCTEDASVDLSSISDDGYRSRSSRRAIFSPYWKKSGQAPLEMVPVPNATTSVEEAAIRSSAYSVQSWSPSTMQELRSQTLKPRAVKSDTALVRALPPSILRKSRYAKGAVRRHTTTGTRSDLEATSNAIAGALAIVGQDPMMAPNSKRGVKFNAKVDVRLFSTARPMEERAEPGWSKQFTY